MAIPTLKKIRVLLQFKSSALELTRIPRPALAHPLSNGLVENCCESIFSLGNLHLLHTQKNRHFNLIQLGFQKTGQDGPVSLAACPSVSQSVSQSDSQSVRQSVRQSVCQSFSQSVSPSVSQSISQSVSQSASQSVSQSVRPSVRQSDSQSVCPSVK